MHVQLPIESASSPSVSVRDTVPDRRDDPTACVAMDRRARRGVDGGDDAPVDTGDPRDDSAAPPRAAMGVVAATGMLAQAVALSLGGSAFAHPSPFVLGALQCVGLATTTVLLGAFVRGTRRGPVRDAAPEPPAMPCGPSRLGSYELLGRIAEGGMGEIWSARHVALGSRAAVKLIRSDVTAASSPAALAEARRAFEREARTTARLRSPHTVRLFDFGCADDGSLYYVMELLDGLDLDELVARFGAQPPARVVYLLRQICHSLAEAHAAGLVHRDVKPRNVQLTACGGDFDVVKVLDFGLVKPAGLPRESLVDGVVGVRGTPGYLAPEVVLGAPLVDPRMDLYAIGCVAWKLLVGRAVFRARDAFGLLRAHTHDAPAPPGLYAPHAVPPELDALVLELLAKDPAARPQSAEEVARRLDAMACASEWTRESARAWWTHRR